MLEGSVNVKMACPVYNGILKSFVWLRIICIFIILKTDYFKMCLLKGSVREK